MSLRIGSWLGMVGSLLALPLAHAVAGPAALESDAWQSRVTLIRLENLPRRYSCEDLQTRVREVLLALGARPDMSIRASACERGPEGYSPQVQLQFATMLTSSTASSQTVRLAPGQLSSWNRGDCELMRQLKEKLLPYLGVKIVAFSLSCLAPAVNSEHYSVIVQAPHSSGSPAKVLAASGVSSRTVGSTKR